jgi:hypothetical protein
MTETTWRSAYHLGEEVHIDGDRSLRAIVTGVLFRNSSPSYELSWVHNGTSCSAWVEPYRVTGAPAR